jgi:hypothetical protein
MCNVQNKTLSMISKNKMYAAMKLPSNIKERIHSLKHESSDGHSTEGENGACGANVLS